MKKKSFGISSFNAKPSRVAVATQDSGRNRSNHHDGLEVLLSYLDGSAHPEVLMLSSKRHHHEPRGSAPTLAWPGAPADSSPWL